MKRIFREVEDIGCFANMRLGLSDSPAIERFENRCRVITLGSESYRDESHSMIGV